MNSFIILLSLLINHQSADTITLQLDDFNIIMNDCNFNNRILYLQNKGFDIISSDFYDCLAKRGISNCDSNYFSTEVLSFDKCRIVEDYKRKYNYNYLYYYINDKETAIQYLQYIKNNCDYVGKLLVYPGETYKDDIYKYNNIYIIVNDYNINLNCMNADIQFNITTNEPKHN